MPNNDINANVKKWYIKNFSDDEVGQTLNEDATFFGAAITLIARKDIYDYLGDQSDSIVRERVFEKLSELLKCDYDLIYKLWLNSETTNESYEFPADVIKKLIKSENQ